MRYCCVVLFSAERENGLERSQTLVCVVVGILLYESCTTIGLGGGAERAEEEKQQPHQNEDIDCTLDSFFLPLLPPPPPSLYCRFTSQNGPVPWVRSHGSNRDKPHFFQHLLYIQRKVLV